MRWQRSAPTQRGRLFLTGSYRRQWQVGQSCFQFQEFWSRLLDMAIVKNLNETNLQSNKLYEKQRQYSLMIYHIPIILLHVTLRVSVVSVWRCSPPAHLLPAPHSVTSCWWPEISHGESFHTTEMGKCSKSGLLPQSAGCYTFTSSPYVWAGVGWRGPTAHTLPHSHQDAPDSCPLSKSP